MVFIFEATRFRPNERSINASGVLAEFLEMVTTSGLTLAVRPHLFRLMILLLPRVESCPGYVWALGEGLGCGWRGWLMVSGLVGVR